MKENKGGNPESGLVSVVDNSERRPNIVRGKNGELEYVNPKIPETNSALANEMLGAISNINKKVEKDADGFPMEVFPEAIRELIEVHVEANTSHRDFLVAGFLSALATISGGKLGVRSAVTHGLNTGDESTSCNLYILIVGYSNEGKSTGVNTFMKPIFKLDSELANQYEAELKEYNKAMGVGRGRPKKDEASEVPEEKPEPTIPMERRYFVRNWTLSSLRTRLKGNFHNNMTLNAFAEEMSGFVDQTKRGNSERGTFAELLTMWDGRPIASSRNDTREGGKIISGTTDVPYVNFSFIGGIQPEILKRFITEDNIGQGSVGRFLMFAPNVILQPRKIKGQREREKIDQADKTWAEMVKSLHQLANVPPGGKIVFKFNEEADMEYENFEELFVNQLVKYKNDGEMKFYVTLGKFREYIVRLALLMKIADLLAFNRIGDTLTITGDIELKHVKSAITMLEYFAKETRKIVSYGDNPGISKFPRPIQDWYNSLPNEFTRDIFKHGYITEEGVNHSADLITYGIGNNTSGKLNRLLANRELFNKETFRGGKYVKLW